MLIDSHCHIDFAEFDADRASVIERARRLNVNKMIVPAVSQSTWQKTINTCSKYQLDFALGLHPMFIEQHEPQHLLELDELCSAKQPIAIGEIGLDFFAPSTDRDKQIAYFSKQLIIAKQTRLPVIIHCRKAHDECLEQLVDIEVCGGIIHAFNGSIQQAKKYIELGCLLGFGGMVTFERSRKLHSLVKQIPMSSIALETDAPDMSVAQHKGQRNSPEYLPYVAEAVAELKGVSALQVAEITSNNVRRTLLQN